jgi:hypothetical protein
MRVAYIFNQPNAANYKLGTMILPQLEAGDHGVEVAGMFFFDDNTYILRKSDPTGERLSKIANEMGILLIDVRTVRPSAKAGNRSATQ